MAATPTLSNDPFTPAKPNNTTNLQDSPFSDYFTDDGRSPDSTPSSSPEKQQLLMRVHKLQSLLMRSDQEDSAEQRETVNIVSRKLHEIESQLNTLHSQTRMPPEMEDSGLFMEDEDEDEAAGDEEVFDAASPSQKKAEHDFLLLESQRVLHSVTTAQEQLRRRHSELRALNDAHILQLDSLRSENSNLKSQVEANEEDLQFLRYQFSALENEVQALDSSAQRLETYAPEIREDIQRVKRMRMSENLARWKRQWEEVEEGMRRRRSGIVEDEKEVEIEELLPAIGSETNGEDAEAPLENGDVEPAGERTADGSADTMDENVLASSPNPSAGTKDIHTASTSSDFAPTQDQDQLHRHTTRITASTSGSAYIDTGYGSPVSQSLWQTSTRDDAELESFEALDCAITTSSEDNGSTHDTEAGKDKKIRKSRGKEKSESKGKSAWAELLEGLASLAGMGEDRFE